MIRKVLVLLVFFLFCLTGGAFAAFRLSGTTAPGAFVEILEVTRSPIYTVAAATEADMIANAVRYRDSAGAELTFNADAAGAINFSYGENQETPSGSGTIGPKTLIVRVWSGGSFGTGNYSYSQQFALGSSFDGIRPITLAFTGLFTQGAPPAPGVTAAQTGFDLSVRPIVNVTLDTTPLAGYEIVSLSGGRYNYTVSGAGGEVRDTDSTSIDLDSAPLVAGNTYTINAFARNGFGDGAVGTGTVVTTAVGAGDVRLNFDLVLRSITGSSPAGINMFGMPFAPDAGGNWYIGTTTIRTAEDLVRAINGSVGANVVSSFGRWNKDTQQVVGVMIRYDSAVVNNINAADAASLNIPLLQGEGYQVYASPLPGDTLTLAISNRIP